MTVRPDLPENALADWLKDPVTRLVLLGVGLFVLAEMIKSRILDRGFEVGAKLLNIPVKTATET